MEPQAVPAAKGNPEMVQDVPDAERKAVADYTQRAKDSEKFEPEGLVAELEDTVRDESTHAGETEGILRDRPL